VLIEHRGEAEFDFRHILHTSYRKRVRRDLDEALRLARQLLKDPSTRLAAAVAGWDHPLSVEALISASLWTAWTGKRHPMVPDETTRSVSEIDTRLADIALENMNRR